MQIGDVISWERTFAKEDVQLFSRISGDYGVHHVHEDEQGRLLVQGLLTATLPTKIGGDLNYLARTMEFEFMRPVFTGDTIHCSATITHVEQREGRNGERRTHMSFDCVCTNQHGKEVLTVRISGLIKD